MLVAKSTEKVETVESYKVKIVTNWNKSKESIIEVGRLLADAKQKLSKDEWTELEDNLPFCKRTANRLISVGSDKRITSGTHTSQLPNSWATLYEISTMKDDEFDDAITTGVLNTKVQRKEISKFINERRGKVQPKVNLVPTEYSETLQFATVYINPDNLNSSDDMEKIQKSIQESIDKISNVRVDFTESQEQIHNKWDREQSREMKNLEKEEESKAKKELSRLIKECKKNIPKGKKFHDVHCISVEELRSMPVDKALNGLGSDYHMFRDTGKRYPDLDYAVA